MNRFRGFSRLLVFWLLISAGFVRVSGEISGRAAKKKPLTPEQTLRLRSIGDLRISPGGENVAMTVNEPVEGTTRNSDIWVYKVNSGELRRFTTSGKSDRFARWAKDGKSLFFLSGRGEKTQIYRIPVDGGEAESLTDSPTGIISFSLSPSGDRLVYLAAEPEPEEKEKKRKDKDDAVVVDKDSTPARLWLFDPASRDTRRLTEGEWRISEFCWGPGGDYLIVSATDRNYPELWLDRIYRLDVEGGEPREIASPPRPFGGLELSPDGRFLAFTGPREDGPSPFDLYVMPLEGGEPRNLSRESIDRTISSFQWIAGDRILCQVPSGFETVLLEISLDGGLEKRGAFPVDPGGSFAVRAGLTAFVGQTFTSPSELWLVRDKGDPETISDFNREWEDFLLIEPEIFKYASFDGIEIEAALYRPGDAGRSDRVPLVVLVHGGPSGRWGRRLQSWSQLLVQRGYAVLCPNIRGSLGYGYGFMASNRRDWGGNDYRDVMAGVDVLVEAGIADPARLGIGGWSYGGYMAAWAVTQTDRFKASVSGAPMTDLAVEYGTEAAGINAYDTWYMGTPYENLKLFMERSPLTYVRKVKTPTLILCGEEDRTDPVGQCRQFHRGLKRYEVPTDLVIYPREGHGLREEKHQIDMLTRVLDWFEKYL